MITPEQIAFSAKIQEIKESGPVSGFALFQAFALWLRDYIDLLVKTKDLTEGIQKPDDINNALSAKVALLDRALQAADTDNKKQIEAYLEFINSLIIDPLLLTPIKNPILFSGHARGIQPGIYDNTLTSTTHSDIRFKPHVVGGENAGNYVALNEHLKPALDCFYSELTKIKLSHDPIDGIIQQWIDDNKYETERSPTGLFVSNQRAITPVVNEHQDIKMFLLPSMGFLFLGGLCSVISLCIAFTDPEANETLNTLPGDLLFPMWAGLLIGIVTGLTNMCHAAWIRRGPHYDRNDKVPPYLNVFIVSPIIAAFWSSIVGLIVAIEQGDYMILADSAWISAVVGVVVGLLCELHRYKHYTSLATEHPQTVQATPSMRQGIEMLPLVEYMSNAPRS